MSEWFANGERIDALAIDDRSIQYGDGVFETIAVRDAMPRFLDAHIERLQLGCLRLGIEPPDPQNISVGLQSALDACSTDTAYATAKLLVTAGSGKRGYRRTQKAGPWVHVGIFDAKPLPDALYRSGVHVRRCATRLARQPQLAGIKSLNRLEQVLARAEWNDDAIFEGLMLDTDGQLICGTMSNVFLIRQSAIITPAITHSGIAGIMRGHIIATLQAAQQDTDIRDVQGAELRDADEVFLANSQFGVLPVQRCGSHAWPVGPVTVNVMRLVAANGVSECAR